MNQRPSNEQIFAQAEWWRELLEYLRRQPAIEMDLREHAILEAFMLTLISPAASDLAAVALRGSDNIPVEAEDREEFFTELARRMIGWAFLLGRGMLKNLTVPPMTAKDIAELMTVTQWDALQTPPRYNRHMVM